LRPAISDMIVSSAWDWQCIFKKKYLKGLHSCACT
jgi:hypothetical protein